jgi:thioredoxin 1
MYVQPFNKLSNNYVIKNIIADSRQKSLIYILFRSNLTKITMQKITLTLTLICLLSMACSTKKKTTKIVKMPTDEVSEAPKEITSSWAFVENSTKNLETILNQAQAEKKLVFIDAYATWCGPCKLMDREVFTHSPTALFFNDNFISYKVNIEKENGPTLKLLYDINGLPTLLFLDAKGNVLEKIENATTVTRLRAAGEAALKKAKR